VSGRVQGVFYRAGTVEQARSLGLDGFVRNLPDGRVEVVLKGARTAISEMIGWLWRGPSRAVVSGVQVEVYTGTVPHGFEVAGAS
jgi:acylphosphatase